MRRGRRVDTTFNGGIQGQPAWNRDIGQHNRFADDFTTRSRMALSVDTRTQTEYGLVRTFGQADIQFSTLGGSTVNPNSQASNLGNNPQLLDSAGGGYVPVELSYFIKIGLYQNLLGVALLTIFSRYS
jgi:hypothetical protein